jgi:hypothetical protein
MSNADFQPSPIVIVAPRQTVHWIIAGALSAIAVALLLRPDSAVLGSAMAQNALAGSRGLHAFTGQLDKDKYGLFMMDVDAGTVWVYEYFPLKRRLKLVCARTFTYDRYLQNYNNDDPTPEQVEALVERERMAASRRGSAVPPVAAAPATPPQANAARAPAGGLDAPPLDVDPDALPEDIIAIDEPAPAPVETAKDRRKNPKGARR